MARVQLGLGFHFHPTDSEGLTFLVRFLAKEEMQDSGNITTNIDVYGNEEPWEIYSQGVPTYGGSGDDDDDDDDSYRYFITKLNKNHHEVGNQGSWKQQKEEKTVYYKLGNSSLPVGCKKSMRYVDKEDKVGDWLMKEYELSKDILQKFDEDCKDYVLCAIKKKPIHDTCSSETLPTMLDYSSEETDEVTDISDSASATSDDKNNM